LAFKGKPSLMSFFTRLDSATSKSGDPTSESASRRAPEPEAPDRQQLAPLPAAVHHGANSAENVEPAGKRVVREESTERARVSDAGPAGPAKMSRGGAAVEWGKILHMKKQKSAVSAVAPPKYLSQKEQKAFLATAAEAPLCPGIRIF